MKKYLSLLLVFCATLFSLNTFAYTAPPAPANGGYVLDETGKLSATEIDQLNHKIEAIKQSTKNEYGVALIQSTGGEDIAEVGQTIFRAWGVGDAKLNNGVLLVIAMAEHKTRIQTGKGVEGDLPDLKASDILHDTLRPYLKQGKFYDGINATLDAIANSLDSRAKVAGQSNDHSSNGAELIIFMFSFIGIGAGILLIFLWTNSRRKERERLNRQERLNRAYESYNTLVKSKHHNSSYVGSALPKPSFAIEPTPSSSPSPPSSPPSPAASPPSSSSHKKPHHSSDYSSSSSSSGFGGGGFGGGGFGGGSSGGGGASGGW